MKKLNLLTTVCFIAITFAACKKTADPVLPAVAATCNTTGTPFVPLYNSLANPLYQDRQTIDLEYHEYDFELTAGDRTICSIGYQAQPSLPGGTYVFTIKDNVTATMVYSGSLSFVTTGFSYVAITPVTLLLNRKYTLSRNATNASGAVSSLIGMVKTNTTGVPLVMPIVVGNMKITATRFLPSTGLLNDKYLPKIDFGLQP
jgi:hypothetical protein